MTHMRRDAPLDLHGVSDVTGLRVTTLQTYRRDDRLPAPDGRLGRTDWWYTSTILDWHRKRTGQTR